MFHRTRSSLAARVIALISPVLLLSVVACSAPPDDDDISTPSESALIQHVRGEGLTSCTFTTLATGSTGCAIGLSAWSGVCAGAMVLTAGSGEPLCAAPLLGAALCGIGAWALGGLANVMCHAEEDGRELRAALKLPAWAQCDGAGACCLDDTSSAESEGIATPITWHHWMDGGVAGAVEASAANVPTWDREAKVKRLVNYRFYASWRIDQSTVVFESVIMKRDDPSATPSEFVEHLEPGARAMSRLLDSIAVKAAVTAPRDIKTVRIRRGRATSTSAASCPDKEYTLDDLR